MANVIFSQRIPQNTNEKGHFMNIRRVGRKFYWRRPGQDMPIKIINHVRRTKKLVDNSFLRFLMSPLLQNWGDSVSKDITIQSITVVSIDYKSNGEPIFAKILVIANDFKGNKLPGVIFLRGGSVAILPILTAKETGEKYVVFTTQTRLAVGECSLLEIPAGMLDGNGDFVGVASKEFEEELGISIKKSDLTHITPRKRQDDLFGISFSRGIFVSPGATDETMEYFLYQKTMPEKKIRKLHGAVTGNEDEHESIKLTVAQLYTAPKLTSDAKFYVALALATIQGLLI